MFVLEALHADQTAYLGRSDYDDIRATVARQLGGYGREGLTRSFQAAFTRALRALGNRGLIRHFPYMGFLQRVADGPDKR